MLSSQSSKKLPDSLEKLKKYISDQEMSITYHIEKMEEETKKIGEEFIIKYYLKVIFYRLNEDPIWNDSISEEFR